jgi:hypothetical protein
VIAQPSVGLRVVGSSRHEIGQVTTKQSGRFVVKKTTPGRARLRLAVLSDANRPSADVDVGRNQSRFGGQPQVVLGLVTAAGGVALLLGRRRHRDA